MSESTPNDSLTRGWNEALGQIEDALEHSLERSCALEPPPEVPGDPHVLAGILHRLEERLDRLEAFLQGAESKAAHADALLTTEVHALEQWLGTWSQARQALARLVEGSPG